MVNFVTIFCGRLYGRSLTTQQFLLMWAQSLFLSPVQGTLGYDTDSRILQANLSWSPT